MTAHEDFDRHIGSARAAITAALAESTRVATSNTQKVLIARIGEQHDLANLKLKEAQAALVRARGDVEHEGDTVPDEVKIGALRIARQNCVKAEGVVAGTWAALQAVKQALST